jgi:hypothetical protein
MILKVVVDGEDIITADSIPVFEQNQLDDGFFCWKDEEWIKVRYRKKVMLNKEYTPVLMSEETINSKRDKVYTVSTSTPIYGHEIEMTITEDCSFIEDIYIGPALAFSGLPDFVKKGLSKTDIVKKYRKSENHIKITIDDWILPGIIVALNWE